MTYLPNGATNNVKDGAEGAIAKADTTLKPSNSAHLSRIDLHVVAEAPTTHLGSHGAWDARPVVVSRLAWPWGRRHTHTHTRTNPEQSNKDD